MQNETTPQDSAAMPPASTGSARQHPYRGVSSGEDAAKECFLGGLKTTVTEDEHGLRFEIEDDGSENFKKAVALTCNPLPVLPDETLTETERLAIEWAAVIAKEQSQVAVHKTLRRLLERLK